MAKAKSKARKTAAKKTASSGKDVVALVKSGKTWAEIQKALGVSTPGKAMMEYMIATEPKIKAKSEKELAKAIATLRDKESMSWGRIAARAEVGEAKVRSLYSEATGKEWSDSRTGRGGRVAGGSKNGTSKASKKVAAKAVKEAAKVAPVASGFTKKLLAMNDEQVAKALTGKKITVTRGDKSAAWKIGKVRKVSTSSKTGDRLVAFDVDGRERIVKLAEISK